jgi:hypothetical protein
MQEWPNRLRLPSPLKAGRTGQPLRQSQNNSKNHAIQITSRRFDENGAPSKGYQAIRTPADAMPAPKRARARAHYQTDPRLGG